MINNKYRTNSPEDKLARVSDVVADPLKLIKRQDNNQVSLSFNKPIRNAAGVSEFNQMVLQSSTNFNNQAAPYITANLSNKPFLQILGKEYENVSSVQLSNIGVDAISMVQNTSTIDVSVMSHLASFAQYCAIERAMTSQNVNITYRNLINSDTGESFKDNFSFYSTDENLLFAKQAIVEQAGVSGSNVLSLGSAVSPSSLKLQILNTLGEIVLEGTDKNSKGVFVYTIAKIPAPDNLVINYDSGIVSLDGSYDTYQLKLNAKVSTGDEDGSNTINVTTEIFNTPLVAEQVRLNYKDDALKQMIWNKNLSNSNLQGDLISDTVHQLSLSFISNMNNRVMNALIYAATTNGLPVDTYNIAAYNVSGSFADTKYDFVGQCIMQTASNFTFDSDQAATSLFVTARLAVLLNGITNGSFVAADTIFRQMDGVIGVYNGMPVIRSRFLSLYEDKITAEAIAITDVDPVSQKPYIKVPFILANKMIDGSAATLAVGEFLPIFSTSMINNYFNPTQFGSSFIAYNAVAVISKKMARIGYLIVDATNVASL